MDPELGRCRRTDGKKWRCRKGVVPDTKYCERHMHRGRSRKQVETSAITLPSNMPTVTYTSSNTPRTTCSRKTSQKIKSHNPADTSARLPTPILEDHQNKDPSLNGSKDLSSTATTITTSSANGKRKTTNTFVENDKSSRENNDDLNGVDTSSDNIKDKTNKGNITNGDKNNGSMTPELSISAKSVVNGDTTQELQRCRRTDGKRWQCNKEVIPQQKYCGSHMHRGSKRCRLSSEAENALVKLKTDDHPNLNTDLSISPAKCSQPTVIDLDSSTSGSSTDATTVTDADENTSASHFLSLSP